MQETDAMLSESQLAMLRKEALVAIGCNISSPRFIDVLLSLDVHVVQKVMWAGIHNDWCHFGPDVCSLFESKNYRRA